MPGGVRGGVRKERVAYLYRTAALFTKMDEIDLKCEYEKTRLILDCK